MAPDAPVLAIVKREIIVQTEWPLRVAFSTRGDDSVLALEYGQIRKVNFRWIPADVGQVQHRWKIGGIQGRQWCQPQGGQAG